MKCYLLILFKKCKEIFNYYKIIITKFKYIYFIIRNKYFNYIKDY